MGAETHVPTSVGMLLKEEYDHDSRLRRLHQMPPSRWIGFGLVWVALVILSVDMVASSRTDRRALPLPG